MTAREFSMKINEKIGACVIALAVFVGSQSLIGSAVADSSVPSWPAAWSPSVGSTTYSSTVALPAAATQIAVSGGAYSYLICAPTTRCYLAFILPSDLPGRTFTIRSGDFLSAASAQGITAPTLTSLPLPTGPGTTTHGTLDADGDLIFTILPDVNWLIRANTPGSNGPIFGLAVSGIGELDIDAQVVDPIPPQNPATPVSTPPPVVTPPAAPAPPAVAAPAPNPPVAVQPAVPMARLAYTGATINPVFVAVAGVLLLLGIGLIFIDRRRRAKAE
jgi:LPXTG-motif cell wall-anchored protein